MDRETEELNGQERSNEVARPLVIAGERVGDLVPGEKGVTFFSTRPEVKALSGRRFESEAAAIEAVSRTLRDYRLSA